MVSFSLPLNINTPEPVGILSALSAVPLFTIGKVKTFAANLSGNLSVKVTPEEPAAAFSIFLSRCENAVDFFARSKE